MNWQLYPCLLFGLSPPSLPPVRDFFLLLLTVAGAATTTGHPRTSPPSPKVATCSGDPPYPVSDQTLTKNSRMHGRKWLEFQAFGLAISGHIRPPPTFKTQLVLKSSIPEIVVSLEGSLGAKPAVETISCPWSKTCCRNQYFARGFS